MLNNYGFLNKKIPVDGVVDFFATAPDYPSGVTKIIPVYGTNGDDRLTPIFGTEEVFYGFNGNDTIDGSSDSKDTLLGGFGNDILSGKDKSDILLGQPGQDLLFGDSGNDVVYGGPGDDVLYGGKDEDKFIIKGGEGIDLIRDFNLSEDIIALIKPLRFENIELRSIIKGKRPNGDNFVDMIKDKYSSLGPNGKISLNGTEIVGAGRTKFKGKTLGYVENISVDDLNDRNLFENFSKSTIRLPDPK